MNAGYRRVDLWVCDIRSWSGTIESYLAGEPVLGTGISAESAERFGRFVRREDAHRGAAGELLRTVAISRTWGGEVARSGIERGRYGKPFLLEYPNVHFNLSHSGDLVVCGTDISPLGVDVEQHRPVDRGVFDQCMTPSEIEWLRRDAAVVERFHTLWTIKESLLKSVGAGLSIDPLDIEVAPIDSGERVWTPRRWPDGLSDRGRNPSAEQNDTPGSVMSGLVIITAHVEAGYSVAISARQGLSLEMVRAEVPSSRDFRASIQNEHLT